MNFSELTENVPLIAAAVCALVAIIAAVTARQYAVTARSHVQATQENVGRAAEQVGLAEGQVSAADHHRQSTADLVAQAESQVTKVRRSYEAALFMMSAEKMDEFFDTQMLLVAALNGRHPMDAVPNMREYWSHMDNVAFMMEQGMIQREWVLHKWGPLLAQVWPMCQPII